MEANLKTRLQLTTYLNYTEKPIYPELEDLIVTPSLEAQNFKSEKYGYNNVKVNGIETENLKITPTLEEQKYDGIYKEIIVDPITGETLDVEPTREAQKFEGVYTTINAKPIPTKEIVITPKNEQQKIEGVYTDIIVNEIEGETLQVTPTIEAQKFEGVYEIVNVNPITGETLNITPTKEVQSYEGVYTKVNAEPIPENLIDTTDADGTATDILTGKTAYVNGEKIAGTIQEYDGSFEGAGLPLVLQDLKITPSTEKQIYDGTYGNVTVEGDSNLIAENIVQDKEIFGVKGNAKTTNAKITSAAFLCYNGHRADYIIELLHLCDSITSVATMCYNCPTLTELDLSFLDTTNVVKANAMFSTCTNLKTLDLTGWDFGKVDESIPMAFYNCTSLTNLKSFKNYGKGFTQQSTGYYTVDLSYSPNLSYESIKDIIYNGLYDLNLTYDVANGGTLYRQILKMSSTTNVLLTNADIMEASNKGWNITT